RPTAARLESMGHVRILILGFVRTAVMALPLFLGAGRLDIPAFWEYLGVFFVFIAAAAFLLDPDMLKERMRPGGKRPGAGLFVVMILYVVQLLAAGLDVGRFHWTPAIPVGVQLGGLVGFVLGLSLIVWAMRTNRFFSSVVRLQTDRGHTLVTGGPYRWVRHPGYTAMLLLCVCNGGATATNVQLKVEKLVYGGEGMGHADGVAVFVPFVLPGETVAVRLDAQKKKFARGRVEKFVELSPERVDAPCPYFTRCGGCHYQHLPYDAQLRYKKEILL